MVSFCSVGPFFGSTRAASILPSRPPNRTAAARRACQGWPRLRGHPKGLALTGPSTAARSIGSGLEAAGIWTRSTFVVLVLPTDPSQHVGTTSAGDGRADAAEIDAVRACRIGKTGTAPIQTGKSNIGAMPHTVQSTNAGAVSHSSRSSSTFGARRGGRNASPLLSVCPLPRSSAHLQLLRSRPDLLCRRLCRTGAARGATRGRTALPNEPPRSRRPCVACPSLSGTAKECDASGFTAAAAG